MNLRTASKHSLRTIKNVIYMPKSFRFGKPEFSDIDKNSAFVDLKSDDFCWKERNKLFRCPVSCVVFVG